MINADAEENLRLIADSVAYLRAQGKRVIYDAEHFFDGYRDDADYAAALPRGGARGRRRERDPLRHERVQPAVTRWRKRPAASCASVGAERVGIHTHNDAECAVANSIAAVEEGAIAGPGHDERRRASAAATPTWSRSCPSLQLKLGYRCVSDEQLASLTEAAHFVDEVCNLTPDPNQPYVGRNAFAHGGGMHVAGVRADARTFEHIDPEVVGNTRELLVSELSGKGTVLARSPRRRASTSTPRAPARASSASRSSSTAATTSRPPTRPSTSCCARSRASTSRSSGSRASASSPTSARTAGSRRRRRSRSGPAASGSFAPPRATGP